MKWIVRTMAVAAALAWAGAPLAFARGAVTATAPVASPAARGYFLHMAKVGHNAQRSAAFIGAGFHGAAFIGRTGGALPVHAVPGPTLASLALGHDMHD
ncbi:MAG TPA: hypothetical protein VMU87_06395 [Stellaceae bacterium]|nr:hypothetical protein [Stellaceae bacterium]